MPSTLIKQARIVNEDQVIETDLRIVGERIEKIATDIPADPGEKIIEANGCYLLPGMIDDQVHFREPGLTHKGTIASESRAAVAGGITSYMDMPNVKPATTTIAALAQKHAIAAEHSRANYAFYLGATEDNLEQIKQLDPNKHCGVKVFMGASTGDLLVEAPQPTTITHENSLYLCGWSPFAGQRFSSQIKHTWVNGRQVFNSDGIAIDEPLVMPLVFDR